MYGQTKFRAGLKEVRNVVGILGGKGGVGKSTVAFNLALALNRTGRRVGILDADVFGPSIGHLIGEVELPKIEEAEIVPAKARGISAISIAFFQKEREASILRAPIANQMIDQFLGKVRWGSLDDLIIDFPPGTGDIPITLMQKAKLSGALFVTTPQELALLDVRKSIQMCELMGVPLLGIVENMSYFLCNGERLPLFGEGGGKRLADESQTLLLGQIPLDTKIGLTGDEQGSLFDEQPASRACFEELANRLKSLLDHKKNEGSGLFELSDLKYTEGSHFEIVWSDGLKQVLRLSDVQKRCPCTRCLHSESLKIDPEVQAIKFKQVGNYALRIKFMNGCSQGIYTFNLLRSIAT